MKLVPIKKEEIKAIRYGKYFIHNMLTEFSLNDGVDAVELVDFEGHYQGSAQSIAITWHRAIKRYGFRMKVVRDGNRIFILKLGNDD